MQKLGTLHFLDLLEVSDAHSVLQSNNMIRLRIWSGTIILSDYFTRLGMDLPFSEMKIYYFILEVSIRHTHCIALHCIELN